ncbi:transcription-repair-coupling factor [Hydrogenophilus thermoluteolus]|uniref:transcription-repair coupling factor n=1 Tax=Hydrogenophilus thermoluteolus TaxID=297 RepID=UPI0024A2FDFF|nr:transcription-repair coupling factor [Hydrogenophilus thermoluteolus]GLW60183.1 transcription-repair-coupling factor [Hydrogenophilus thermoluteolus]
MIPDSFHLPKAGQRAKLPLPYSGLAAPYLAELKRRTRAPLVLLAANAAETLRIQAELTFFAPMLRVCHFPDWETLPYDPFSPHQDLISERLATLFAITQQGVDVVVTSVAAALPRLTPPAFVAGRMFRIRKGETLDLAAFKAQLTLAGYEPAAQVLRPGEFAIRGGIIDLYPMGAALPYRLELFDDEIETIKTFDPDTQRTLYPVEAIELLPAREFPTDDDGRTTFRRRFRETFEGDPSKVALYKQVSQGLLPAGIEYYLPLFFDKTATLFDYLPDALWVTLGPVAETVTADWQEALDRYRLLNTDPDRPLLPPDAWMLPPEAFHGRLSACARIDLALPEQAVDELPPIALDARAEQPAAALAAWLDTHRDWTVLLAVSSEGRRETVREKLRAVGWEPSDVREWETFLAEKPPLALTVAPVENGFLDAERRLAFFGEAELFAHLVRRKGGTKRKHAAHDPEAWIRDLTELTPGAPVVHLEHGIGRYRGLVRLAGPEGEAEFLHLEYAGGAALYVPVTQLALIGRYLGTDPETVPLHELGSGQWEKEKRKAAEKAHDTAAELLALYAERAARGGERFAFDAASYEAFAAGFPFETTPDQQAAIDAVIADLTSGKVMDRLVCGDVGFGKTEVALRAAFLAAMNGRQVAILTPTTLLAEQHTQTFRNRFAGWPLQIAELSRFTSSKNQKATLAALADGTVDIVIGTHRLIQPDVRFARLGLVIIDEEHRFGVRQKEALRTFCAHVHTLSLSATPIPRTLGMALEGVRDFSVIATPPAKRLAVKTFVVKKSDALIREAVARELRRGGQVFYVHNEVRTIGNALEALQKLLPNVRIGVAHGQMSEIELERVMRDFIHQRLQVLLCTTIIETGIDIPNANTILIERADRFGLAQLHQLRGRVGRSHHQAFAYLMLDPHIKPTAAGARRLEAIAQAESLGGGFTLAMHDLEIRGAGEILGEAQSGAIESVGFALFTQMLQTAVRRLKAQNATSEAPGKAAQSDASASESLLAAFAVTTEITLGEPALLPESYCPDIAVRLDLYKRLADAADDEAVDALKSELIDRFGPLPPQAVALIATHRLRIRLLPYRVARVDANAQRILVRFATDAPVDPAKVVALIQSDRTVQIKGSDTLVRTGTFPTHAERAAAVERLVQSVMAQTNHATIA